MNVIVTVGIFIAMLFLLAYVTKRRFGVLGLALAAGALLSGMWAGDVTPIVQQAGVQIIAPPMKSVVAAVLIVLPAIALLFSGPKYHTRSLRLIGSAAFALLAVAFLLDPLGGALVLNGDGSKQTYTFLYQNQNWIVTAGIIYAIFDLLSAKASKPSKEK